MYAVQSASIINSGALRSSAMTFRKCGLPCHLSMSLGRPLRRPRRAGAAAAANRRGGRLRRGETHLAIESLEPKLALTTVGGLDRLAYGVWDREGGHSVSVYPYTRGQEYAAEWTAVNTGRNQFNWTALDASLQLAADQNQKAFIKIQPVSSTTVPPCDSPPPSITRRATRSSMSEASRPTSSSPSPTKTKRPSNSGACPVAPTALRIR
jgi:hypothetical protein